MYYPQSILYYEEEMNQVKIKFTQSNAFVDPMEVFKQNPEEVNTQWLFWRSKSRCFNVGHTSLCLLKLSYDT